MRLYGRKYARNYVDRRVSRRAETRDGIIWSVDVDDNLCWVKIQGSSYLILAHFPRNWKTVPYWLKRGNAVRICHRTGVRGYIEVAGEGRAIPTPVSGSNAFPSLPALPDMILTGCQVIQTVPKSMGILVTSGTYRINGIEYILDPESYGGTSIIMNDPAPMTMGGADVMGMGDVQYSVEIDAAPAEGLFRYDIIVVGIDGVIDYIAGVPSDDPSKPDTPENHLLLATIFVKGGVTEITNSDINATEWKTSFPASLSLEYDQDFVWSAVVDTPTTDIKVTVVDQYGSALVGSYTLKLTKTDGTGDMYSSDDGWQAGEVEQSIINGSEYTFQYRRNQLVAESSPYFTITLSIASPITRSISIVLLDSTGLPII